MIHGLSNIYLYAAKRVITYWKTSDGEIRKVPGTGFAVTHDEDIYLITNRHVAELSYTRPQYTDNTLLYIEFEGYEDIDESNLPNKYTVAQIVNGDEFVYHSNENNDIACLKNPRFKVKASESINIAAAIPFEMLAAKDRLDKKLTVCDTVAYPGFPEWFDKKNRTPIFRMGTIASDPRFGYSPNTTAPDADIIAYEGFSSNGASGSPVFAIQKGFKIGNGLKAPDDFYREVMVVGINAGHYSGTEGHSGISYFYKSSAILEVIEKCNC